MSDNAHAHQNPRYPTCCHGSSGCNGRDDLASNELGLELVNLRDAVVAGAHIGQAGNHVHVEVCVVILLKHNGA